MPAPKFFGFDMYKKIIIFFLITFFFMGSAYAGPYTEAGVNGYIDDDWRPADPNDDGSSRVNPIFRDWAKKIYKYEPSPGVAFPFRDTSLALGPPTGDKLDAVSLGDVNTDIYPDTPPGEIIIAFNEPNNVIQNTEGYDFAIFENGFVADDTDSETGIVAGEMFAELAFVEVSTDCNDFARFPSVSLTSGRTGDYGTIEISNVYNLAGKHPNGAYDCTGTPFDLSELANDPLVLSGSVNLNNIKYIRIVDIPGGGWYFDQANSAGYIDPNTYPEYNIYGNDHPIYDAWVTVGSGGFDLEAVGVLNEQEFEADINLDGLVDMHDFYIFASAWQKNFGDINWIGRCNLAEPRDKVIDFLDLIVFVEQWLSVEKWRSSYVW
ncbi:MAG: hypothetical protein JW912_02325 [Sedimentisphaerales bacterium]|nr:hypothetical protein [Sedimentisphaerales bacterium]